MKRNTIIEKVSITFTQIVTSHDSLYALDINGHVWRYGHALIAGANTLSGGSPTAQWQRLPAYIQFINGEREK